MIYIYIYSPYIYFLHIWYSCLADISWAKSHPCHVIFQPEAIPHVQKYLGYQATKPPSHGRCPSSSVHDPLDTGI